MLRVRRAVALGHIAVVLHKVGAHVQDAEVGVVAGAAVGHDAGGAFAYVSGDTGQGGLPQGGGVDLADAEVGGDDFDGLVQVFARLHVILFKETAEVLVGRAALGGGDDLAVEPAGDFFVALEFGGVLADHDERAAGALGHAEGGDHLDFRLLRLGAEDGGGHDAHIADLRLVRQHVVGDDGALQGGLKFDFRTGGGILLPEPQFGVDDGLIGDGVIGLEADDELFRSGGGGEQTEGERERSEKRLDLHGCFLS